MSCTQEVTAVDADANLGKDPAPNVGEPNSKKAKIEDEKDSRETEETGEIETEIAEEEETVTDATKSIEHEESLGITERINKDNKRFRGLMKQITTDFIVNEIDLDNQVVYLNDLNEPRIPDQEDNPSSAESVAASSQEEYEQSMRKILGEVKYQELTDFLSSNSSTSSFRIEAPSKLTILISTDSQIGLLKRFYGHQEDKLDRKKVHDFFKMFHKAFTSNTVNEVNKETKLTQQIIEICHQKYQVSRCLRIKAAGWNGLSTFVSKEEFHEGLLPSDKQFRCIQTA